ncbi:hypothetical protein DXG01_001456 [Tephrocybe rancida]|nr:hypothetical protein DXG01_001456 [Tephrocybe rancida]
MLHAWPSAVGDPNPQEDKGSFSQSLDGTGQGMGEEDHDTSGDYMEENQEEDNKHDEHQPSPPKKKRKRKAPQAVRKEISDKMKNKFAAWCETGMPPPPTDRAHRAMSIIASISLDENLIKLDQLLLSLEPSSVTLPTPLHEFSPGVSDPWIPLQSLSLNCSTLENDVKQAEFNFIVAQVQLVLCYDIICKEEARKGRSPPSRNIIYKRLNVSYDQFRDWVEMGTRLAFLAAADDELRTGLKGQLLPILLGLQKYRSSCLSRVQFLFSAPFGGPGYEICDGEDYDGYDRYFTEVQMEYFGLPHCSSHWTSVEPYRSPRWVSTQPSSNLPPPLPEAPSALIAQEAVTLKMPKLRLSRSKCPMNKTNREDWTAKQRMVASSSYEVADLDDLKAKLLTHTGQGQYLKMVSSIFKGNSVMLQDAEANFAGLLLTHMPLILPGCNKDLLERINALMPGELHYESSMRDLYSFLSLHFSWYNCYSEKGTGAPPVHPHYIYKDGVIKVNHSQRKPQCSKEIQQDPQEYHLLAQYLKGFFEFIEANLQHHLPQEYEQLVAYVDHLPLKASSPAHPFGGFILNFCVSTHSHRDFGDKILCVVVPFEDYTGGELCLFEPGLVIDLAPGDVFIFPSADITHFNLHFEGVCLSLVLHSDKQGDSWAADTNFWEAIYWAGNEFMVYRACSIDINK